MNFSGLIFISAIALLQGCASLRTLEQATQNQEELNDEVEITSSSHEGNDSGKTAFPYLKALGKPPGRVALVSYFVQSPPTKSGNITTVLTAEGAGKIADNLVLKSIEPLKKNFKKHGMELLVPSEFLTDESVKTFYNDFQMKIEGGASFMDSVDKVGEALSIQKTGLFTGAAPAKGYKQFDRIDMLATFASVTDSIGFDLAKGLGVDAVLVVVNETPSDSNHAFISQARMYLFGPNPITLKEEDLGGWTDGRKGHLYAAIAAEKSIFKNVSLNPPEAGNLDGLDDEKNYRGFEKITDALSNKLTEYVDGRTRGK